LPTHGALSKAGKVRSQTPLVEKTKLSISPIPRIANARARSPGKEFNTTIRLISLKARAPFFS